MSAHSIDSAGEDEEVPDIPSTKQFARPREMGRRDSLDAHDEEE